MFRRITTLAVGLAVAAGVATAGAGAAEASSAAPITIKANHSIYTATATGTFSIHLGIGQPEYVNIFRTLPGQQPVYEGYVKTNAQGNATYTAPMLWNATWSANFPGGDGVHVASLGTTTVTVIAYMSTALTGDFKTVSGYHEIHSGSRGNFAGLVYPSRAGEYLHFPLQYYSKGGWHTAVHNAYKMVSHTEDGVTYSTTGTLFSGSKGYAYRIRAEYSGDPYLAHRYSNWTYVKFV